MLRFPPTFAVIYSPCALLPMMSISLTEVRLRLFAAERAVVPFVLATSAALIECVVCIMTEDKDVLCWILAGDDIFIAHLMYLFSIPPM